MKLVFITVFLVLCFQDARTDEITCTAPWEYSNMKQCDPRWSNQKLGSTTICKSGSFLCSLASALYGAKKKVTYKCGLFKWSTCESLPTCAGLLKYLESKTKLGKNTVDLNNQIINGLSSYIVYKRKLNSTTEIKKAICENKIVLLNISKDTSKPDYLDNDWALVHRYCEDQFLVINPTEPMRFVISPHEIKSALLFSFH